MDTGEGESPEDRKLRMLLPTPKSVLPAPLDHQEEACAFLKVIGTYLEEGQTEFNHPSETVARLVCKAGRAAGWDTRTFEMSGKWRIQFAPKPSSVKRG